MNKNKNTNTLKNTFPYLILLLVVIGTLIFFNFAGHEVHELLENLCLTSKRPK